MHWFITYLSCLIGLCPAPAQTESAQTIQPPPIVDLMHIEPLAGSRLENAFLQSYGSSNLAGNYLSAQFAQQHHDWAKASEFMGAVLQAEPDNFRLQNKAMILYMGAGQAAKAVTLAHDVLKQDPENALALLFVATESFRDKNYEEAENTIKKMPAGSLSDFMLPLLNSWAKAGIGSFDVAALDKNTIHIYHSILIADFLNKKEEIEPLLQKSMTAQGLTLEDTEHIADVYGYIGKTDTALELYNRALDEWPQNKALAKKIAALKNNQASNFFKPVSSPERGVAEGLYEMSRLLFREQSDDSAQIFSHMALFLDPSMTDAKIILAHIASRNERENEAIAFYRTIEPENENYSEARRLVAGLHEDEGRIDEALVELDSLYREYGDIEALIQIGDIYRRNEDFGKAVATYNQAADVLGTIPKEYWRLYYVRGMSYEQSGQWQEAEKDLKAALAFQPDHPLVMNYLGYAWADQGVNLQQSLELIRKAADLEDSDGYIIDSLGWVLYRSGDYNGAIPELEKAVELLPYDPVINDHLGDAYWQVGRKLEARFQWLRAKNNSEDSELNATIAEKLESGLMATDVVKEARSESRTDITSH